MKLIFSRKGFDSTAGGAPSPIIGGRPVSLPIPYARNTATTFGDLGLGEVVAQATRGRLRGDSLCHPDPMFRAGRCAFGQAGAAQAHLANQAVGRGDVFLFFGLFAEPGDAPHHRIFGWLRVERVRALGAVPGPGSQPAGFPLSHPHAAGEWPANNTLYEGPGGTAARAPESLRLTRPGSSPSQWRVPRWLKAAGLSYHGRAERWDGDGLRAVSRGQEFVTDITGNAEAQAWLSARLAEMGA